MQKYIRKVGKNGLLSILILTLSTLLGFCFRSWGFHETNIVVIYIFSVLLISRFTKGYLYGICASVISILLFNWFFTVPYFTFKVNDMTYLITFAIMMVISIVTSALTTKVKQAVIEAKEREAESNALYHLTNCLTDAEDMNAIAEIMIKTSSDALGCNASCILFDENGVPEKTFLQYREDGIIIHRELQDCYELCKRMRQFCDNQIITDYEYDYPIFEKNMILAILRIPAEKGSKMTSSQSRMLHSIIESAALALERLRSLQAQAKSREETAQERYRGNLLRAISHDIRTPLSGIMGTSEMLIDMTDPDDPRYALAKDVYNDADWLHGLVENILNLTKLQEGRLTLNKQPEAVEEAIGAALMVMEKRLPERVIEVEMPERVVMVPMDAKLISQVLINLLDNAAKHTEKNDKISICVSTDDNYASITVTDHGHGIAEQDLPYIFQMFYTSYSKSPDAKQRGVGLGLAICQSIVEAHGGNIRAENRKEGGASFTFTLPLEDDSHDEQK